MKSKASFSGLIGFVLLCIILYFIVTFWYISIPLIILGVIYFCRAYILVGIKFILILGAIVLICIAVYYGVIFWYISIPLVISAAGIYYYRGAIRERIAKKVKTESQQEHNHEYYQKYSSQQDQEYYQKDSSQQDQEYYQKYSSQQDQEMYQKNLEILEIFKISKREAESILGKEWKTLNSIESLYWRTVRIGLSKKEIRKIPEDLILKFSEIFESIYQMRYKILYSNIKSTYSQEQNDTRQNYKEILENCRECYENYAGYKTNQENYEESDSYERNNSRANDSDNKTKDNYSRSEYEDNHSHWKYEKNNSGGKSSGKYSKAKAARVKARLAKFQITDTDAEIIFGENWKEKLGKTKADFYFTVLKIEGIIQSDFYGRYKRKLGNLYDKVLKIIDIIIGENPETDRQNYEESDNYERNDSRANDSNDYDESEYDSSEQDYKSNYDNYEKNEDDNYEKSEDDNYEKSEDDNYEKSEENNYEKSEENNYENENQYSDQEIVWAFSVMGLKQNATEAEIKSKHIELILKYHPDRNNGSSDANAMTVKINAAMEIFRGMRKSA